MRSFLKTLAMSEIKRVFPFVKNLKKDNKLLELVLAAVISPLVFYRRYIEFAIPYIEIVVTPKCNLNCAGCANLMPLYEKNCAHADLEALKKSIDLLLGVSKRIEVMKFIGGEPFLYGGLGEVVEYASKSSKIKNIIITTNGSVTPKPETLNKIKNPKITVEISKYSVVNREKMTKALKKENIKYNIIEFESWQDYGDVHKRNFNSDILKRSFAECASAECKTVLNGRLYLCPRAAHGHLLGIIPTEKHEFAELLKADRKAFERLYSLPYITACDYCTPVWKRTDIECGVQNNN